MASSNADLSFICGVCSGPYKTPKMLPTCGHSFCLECIERLKGSSNGSSIKCPECQTQNIIGPKGPQGMKTNVMLERILATIEAYKVKTANSTSDSLSSSEKDQPQMESVQPAPRSPMDTSFVELCTHLKPGDQSIPRSCLHCGHKFCQFCEVKHKEIIKVNVLEKADGLKNFAEKHSNSLAEVERFLLEKAADCEARIANVGQKLDESYKALSEERTANAKQLVHEIVEAKMTEMREAYEKVKAAVARPSELTQPNGLATKSVLFLSLEELATLNHNIMEVNNHLVEFETLKSQVTASEMAYKDDEKLQIDLMNLMKDPSRRPLVKWISAANVSTDALAKLHRAIDTGSLEAFVEAVDLPSLSPAAITALVETRSPTYENRTALLRAVYLGRTEIVKYLVKNCHADVYAGIENKVTSAHLAASNGYLAMLRFLVEHDRKLATVHDSFGATPLPHAAFHGHIDCCKFLLEQPGCDIENQGEAKRTPLLYAASSGRRSIVELLIERGANTQATDEKGMTALHLASYFGYSSVVRYLLRTNAALLNAKDIFGQTAYVLAKACNKQDVVAIFHDFDRQTRQASSK